MGATETPESRAMRVTDAILDFVMVDGENVSASVLHPATEVIAQAIRDAENAALDKAAAHVEQFAPAISASAEHLPGMEKVVERLAEMVSVSIPGEIRSLKQRDAT